LGYEQFHSLLEGVVKPLKEKIRQNQFRKTSRKPYVRQAQTGLVAIDECHLVKQWKEFRQEFTVLGELRIELHQDVLYDEASDKVVLSNTGFRSVGRHL